jgi:hypothetical protein
MPRGLASHERAGVVQISSPVSNFSFFFIDLPLTSANRDGAYNSPGSAKPKPNDFSNFQTETSLSPNCTHQPIESVQR